MTPDECFNVSSRFDYKRNTAFVISILTILTLFFGGYLSHSSSSINSSVSSVVQLNCREAGFDVSDNPLAFGPYDIPAGYFPGQIPHFLVTNAPCHSILKVSANASGVVVYLLDNSQLQEWQDNLPYEPASYGFSIDIPAGLVLETGITIRENGDYYLAILNHGDSVVQVSGEWTVDIWPPTIEHNLESMQVVTGTYRITAAATDEISEIVYISLIVDGDEIYTEDGEILSYDWNTNLYANGGHNVTLEYADDSNNHDSVYIIIIVSNTAPSPGNSELGTVVVFMVLLVIVVAVGVIVVVRHNKGEFHTERVPLVPSDIGPRETWELVLSRIEECLTGRKKEDPRSGRMTTLVNSLRSPRDGKPLDFSRKLAETVIWGLLDAGLLYRTDVGVFSPSPKYEKLKDRFLRGLENT